MLAGRRRLLRQGTNLPYLSNDIYNSYRGNFWMPNSKNMYIGKLGILFKLGGVGSSPFTFRRPCRWHHTVSTLLYNEDGSLWGIAASQVHKIWTHFEKMSLYIEYLYLYCYVVHQVLASCGFQWFGFHLCVVSKSSPNIQLMQFSLHNWRNSFTHAFLVTNELSAADFCQT